MFIREREREKKKKRESDCILFVIALVSVLPAELKLPNGDDTDPTD